MNGDERHWLGSSSSSSGKVRNRSRGIEDPAAKPKPKPKPKPKMSTTKMRSGQLGLGDACFLSWSLKDALGLVKQHPIPLVFGMCMLFFMGVEYTLLMIPPSSPPFDLGFVLTRPIHRILASQQPLNTLLAGLNTVFVGMQTTYILWTWLVEGRGRPTIAALFMFTCRGILGYSTQLPLPEGFLGSGVDFPVGNVSFFLFFSGHVAGSVIASMDMRRMKRRKMAMVFEWLNGMQMVRLLATRGHYTIDLAVGVGAGLLFDSLAGKYDHNYIHIHIHHQDDAVPHNQLQLLSH